MQKSLTIYKYLAIGALSLYALKRFQSNPLSMGATPFEVQQKANKLIDNLVYDINAPPQYKNYINNLARNVASSYIKTRMYGEKNRGFNQARDVTGSAG